MKPLMMLTLLATSVGANAMSAGEYVAKAGDCAACHTSPQGQALAGGMRFATPLGIFMLPTLRQIKHTALAAIVLRILIKRCGRGSRKMGTICTQRCHTRHTPK